MEKQKKQLLFMLLLLALAILTFVGAAVIPEEKEEEAVSYQITNFATNEVTKLEYSFDEIQVKLEKLEDEWWNEEDKSMDIDEETVTGMIAKVASLTSENRIEKVTDVSIYGLANATKKVRISDGVKSYTLIIGDYNDMTSTYYVCLEEDMSTVYTMSSTKVNAFDMPIESLVVEEETTAEETTPVQEESESANVTE